MAEYKALTAIFDADIRMLQSSINRASAQLRQYEQGTNKILGNAASSWQGFVTRIKSITQSISSTLFSLQGALAVVGAGFTVNKVLSDFGDMNQGLIEVQKTANLTSAEVGLLEKRISELSTQIPVSVQGLLEIAGAAGQLGVKGVDNLVLFTETMAKMQLASDVVGAEGAKDLARLLNTAGEGTRQISTLASVIVALGNNAAASESEIVRMAGEIGRSVAAFRVSSAEAAALGTALRAMGAQAELSGSAVVRAMIEMQKVIDEGGDKFKRLQELTQMTGDELRNTFETNTMKVFTAFIHGLNRATKQGQSAVSILEEFGMSGTEAAKGLTPLIKNVEKMDEAFAIANEELKNTTALNEEAARATTSFKNQMQLTKNIIFDISKSIGKGLAPSIIQLNKNFRDWADRNKEFIQQDLYAYMMKLGDALLWLGEEVVVPVIKFIGDLWDILSTVPKGVIGFLIGVHTELKKVEEGAKNTAKQVKNITPPELSTWTKYVNFMGEVWEDTVDGFIFVGKTVGNIFGLMVGDALEAVKIIGKEFIALGRIIWNIFTFDFAEAKQVFKQLVTDMEGFGKQIAINWNVATQNIKNDWDTMVRSVLYGAQTVKEAAKETETTSTAPTTAPAPNIAMASVSTQAVNKAIELEQELQQEIRRTENLAINVGWEIDSAYQGFMQGLYDYVNTYSSVADNVRSTTQYLAYDMESAFTDFFSAASDDFLNFRSLALTVMGDIQREITRMLIRQAIAGIGSSFLGAWGGGGFVSRTLPMDLSLGGGGSTPVSNVVGNLSLGGGGGATSFADDLSLGNFGFSSFVFHKGGIVGQTNSERRIVPSGIFANAPRLHDGLRADEFPAILQKGETVIPAGQKEKDIKIINVLDPSIVGQYMQTQEGEELVVNIMQKNGGI